MSLTTDDPDMLCEIQAANPVDWEFDHHSTSSVVATNILWLTLIQAGRLVHGGEFFSLAFLITLPTDLALTYTSHLIAIGPRVLDPVRRLLKGETFGPRFESATRIGANTVMGASYIVTSWVLHGLLTGSPVGITPIKCLGAVGLCLAVYTGLQWLKTHVFHHLPRACDRRHYARLRRKASRLHKRLKPALCERAEAAGLDRSERKLLAMTLIDRIALRLPYEVRARCDSALTAALGVAVSTAEESSGAATGEARRALVRELLALHDDHGADPGLRAAVRTCLSLGAGLEDDSIVVHRLLLARHDGGRWRVRAAALLDQFVATGLAGGVGLYNLNAWALTT